MSFLRYPQRVLLHQRAQRPLRQPKLAADEQDPVLLRQRALLGRWVPAGDVPHPWDRWGLAWWEMSLFMSKLGTNIVFLFFLILEEYRKLCIQFPEGTDGVPGGPQLPGIFPVQYPGQTPGVVPGQVPGVIPGQIPIQIPGQVPGQIPGQIPGQVPGQVPGQFPFPYPGHLPLQPPPGGFLSLAASMKPIRLSPASELLASAASVICCVHRKY